MYDIAEYNAARKAYRLFMVFYFGGMAVLCELIAVACIYRSAALVYAVAILAALGSVFAWGYYWRRLNAYRSYMQQVMHGLQREDEGVIHQIGDTPTVVDGIECIGIRLLTGDPEADAVGGRQLYYDCAKLPFAQPVGARVRLITTGYFIKDIQPLKG